MPNSSLVLTVDDVVIARRKKQVVQFSFYLVCIGLVLWSIQATIIDDTDWDRIGSLSDIGNSISHFIGIDFELIPDLLGPTIETFMIACIGTLLGLVICIPAIWFGALNVTPYKPVTYPIARVARLADPFMKLYGHLFLCLQSDLGRLLAF